MKVDLTETDRRELLALKRHGRTWRERQRAEALLWLDRLGSTHEVAAQLDTSERTVRRCCIRWREDGLSALAEGDHSGRRPLLSPEQVRWLCEEAERLPQTAGQLREALKIRFPGAPVVSQDTVKAALRREGFRYKRTRYGLKKSAQSQPSRLPGSV